MSEPYEPTQEEEMFLEMADAELGEMTEEERNKWLYEEEEF